MSLSSNPRVRLAELRERWDADRRSRVFLQLAEEYRRQGQPGDAIGVLEVGLSHNPSSVAGQVALGRCLLELGRFPESRDVLEAVLSRDPTQMVAYRQLIDVHLQLNEVESARTRLGVYEQLNPLDPELDQLRARIDGAAPKTEVDTATSETPEEDRDVARAATPPSESGAGEGGFLPAPARPPSGDSATSAVATAATPEDPKDLGSPESSAEDDDAAPSADLPNSPGDHAPPGSDSDSSASNPAPAANAAVASAEGMEHPPTSESSGLADRTQPPTSTGRERTMPTWGEIFRLPTDLAGSRLQFGPLERRSLLKHPPHSSAAEDAPSQVTDRARDTAEEPGHGASLGHSKPATSTLATLYRQQGHEEEAAELEGMLSAPSEVIALAEEPAHLASRPPVAAPVADPVEAVGSDSGSAPLGPPEPTSSDSSPGAELGPSSSEPEHPADQAPALETSHSPSSSSLTKPGNRDVLSPLGDSVSMSTLDAAKILSMNSRTLPGLEMTPTLERRRRLVGNYLEGLRALRKERP
jgi:tetratricopeptide (TPR) repeat protein